MATGEVYVQLAVNFADNRKLRKLVRFGSEARGIRDLFVQMVCHCKANLTDGFVPAEQIGLLVYPDPESVGQRDAGRLAEVGLVTEVAGGFDVTGYLERNPSKADVLRRAEAKASGARMANHKRWHVEEGISDPRCPICRKSDQTTDQTTDRTSDQTSDQSPDSQRVGTDSGSDSTETKSETETETVASDDARQPECGSDDDPDFAAFWDVYPKKAAKGQARKAWRTAIRTRREDPRKIIQAATECRERHRRERTDKKYIPNPATWLNGESYDDTASSDQLGAAHDPWEQAWRN